MNHANIRRALLLSLLLLGVVLPALSLDLLLAREAAAQNRELGEIEEYPLKAVYLYNFLHFVSWPEAVAPAAEEKPLVIGLVGKSPFGEAFTALQQSLREGNKKSFTVVEYGKFRPGLKLQECNLLFISAEESRNYKTILQELAGAPVLTVSDGQEFLEAGGMIALLFDNGKIRWAINRPPVQVAGLRLQAQLLKIAVKVISDPERSEMTPLFPWERRLAGLPLLLPATGLARLRSTI